MDFRETIEEAVGALRQGGVILYPTDTVWGLGCDATDERAVERIFRIKKRAAAKSLVLLACDMDMVARYVKQIPDIAIDLVEVNDAPMTVIYPGAQGLAANVIAEDGSVGIRIPAVPEEDGGDEFSSGAFCRQLVRRFGRPLVSTSANVSGEATPLRFREIAEEIVASVDYAVPQRFERGATGKASQIIKVGLGSEIEIIRP